MRHNDSAAFSNALPHPWKLVPRVDALVALLALVLLNGNLIGCRQDTTGPTLIPASQAFYQLVLNQHAINMATAAPYDTIRLTAEALTATGTQLTTTNRVKYSALDSNVTVDSTGLVTAHYVTSQTQVTASLTVSGVTLTDVATIQITPTALPAPLATLSIQPEPDGLDSARAAVDLQYLINNFNGNIPVYATIAAGDPASDTVCNVNGCSLLVHFRSSNSAVAGIDPLYGILNFNGIPDTVTFFVETWAYGVAKQDSLKFSVGYAHQANIAVAHNGCARQLPFCFLMDSVKLAPHGRIYLEENGNNLLGWSGADTVKILLSNSAGVIDSMTLVPGGANYSDNSSCCFFLPPGLGTYTLSTFPKSNELKIIASDGPCLKGEEPYCL